MRRSNLYLDQHEIASQTALAMTADMVSPMVEKRSYIYIMTNAHNTVLYTGVTTDLKRRVWQHKEEQTDGFTKRYNVTKLVYYEECGDVRVALAREKQLKGGSRQKKIDLINVMNSEWRDLYDDL